MSAGLDEASRTQEDWEALDAEEQDEKLDAALERKSVSADEPDNAADEIEMEEMDDDDVVDTMAALQAKAKDTWTARVLDGDVPFDLYEMSNAQYSKFKQLMQLFKSVSQSSDVEDLDPEVIDDLDNADEILAELLGAMTVDDRFDTEFWLEGDYPRRTNMELFGKIMRRTQGQERNTEKFR